MALSPSAPAAQSMNSDATEFDVLLSEEKMMEFESFDMAGTRIKGLLTDKRLILRASESVCAFPLNLFCVCFQAEVDSSYSILDLKNVKPYVASGCVADCMGTMFKLATDFKWFCCCLPKLLPNGVHLGFSRPAGDYVPFWSFPWLTGQGSSFSTLRLQLHREDAIKLRKILVTHPNAKGLGYTIVGKQ